MFIACGRHVKGYLVRDFDMGRSGKYVRKIRLRDRGYIFLRRCASLREEEHVKMNIRIVLCFVQRHTLAKIRPASDRIYHKTKSRHYPFCPRFLHPCLCSRFRASQLLFEIGLCTPRLLKLLNHQRRLASFINEVKSR